MTDDHFFWLNPPPFFSEGKKLLTVRTGWKTDFWQNTFYGFKRDNGHFYHRNVVGDFSAEVTIVGKFSELYDQAGLMIRCDAQHWLKCGVEYSDGRPQFSTVVTNAMSDWSLSPLPTSNADVSIRVTRHIEAIRVQLYNVTLNHWVLVRLAYLPMTTACQVGMMCCTPERDGLEVEFRNFKLGPAIPRELHTDFS